MPRMNRRVLLARRPRGEPAALVGLLRGESFGKVVLRVAPDRAA